MEEKIERIINAAFRISEPECADLAAATEAAAEIAKLVEAKIAELEYKLQTKDRAASRWHEELSECEAQLAEMREALEKIRQFIKPALWKFAHETELPVKPLEDMLTIIDKALSAAPVEVLWAGKATIWHRYGMPPTGGFEGTMLGTEDSGLDITDEKIGKDGQQVKVIVMAGKEKGNGSC